jgi:hypothetical protein
MMRRDLLWGGEVDFETQEEMGRNIYLCASKVITYSSQLSLASIQGRSQSKQVIHAISLKSHSLRSHTAIQIGPLEIKCIWIHP